MREPQVQREPVPHERQDERLIGPPAEPPSEEAPRAGDAPPAVDIPDGEGHSDDNMTPDEAAPEERERGGGYASAPTHGRCGPTFSPPTVRGTRN